MATDIKTEQKDDFVGDICFYPPLYQQRYATAVNFLEQRNVTKVVDFGCAECKVMPMIRRIPTVEDLIGVDIDRALLSTRKFILKPLISDFISPREHPLRIRLYEGSIAEYDSRLAGADAITMIEVIEHLMPDVLAAFPTMLFGKLQPKYVLITTPNQEFNVLFENFVGMRHDDHKFEWTRSEFQEWCKAVCDRFPYTVDYGGVGDPPARREDVGHCSQYAIFTSKNLASHTCVNYVSHVPNSDLDIAPQDKVDDNTQSVTYNSDSNIAQNESPNISYTTESIETLQHDNPYVLVYDLDNFPNRARLGSDAALLLEANYQLHNIARSHAQTDDYDMYDDDNPEGEQHIALKNLMEYHSVKKLCTDINKLREVLTNAGYRISEDLQDVIVVEEEDDDDDELDDKSGQGNDQIETDNDEEVWNNNCVVSEERWSDDDDYCGDDDGSDWDDVSKSNQKVIPYFEMWQDIEPDDNLKTPWDGSKVDPGIDPDTGYDDPDMLWVPSVLHAPVVRCKDSELIRAADFPSPTKINSRILNGVRPGMETDFDILDSEIEPGQFDDFDDEEDGENNSIVSELNHKLPSLWADMDSLALKS